MTCTICEICIQKFSVSGSMERRSIHYQDLPGYLYVIEASDAEATDFVRLFGCDDSPDVAVHLTPALYDPRAAGLPNLGFGVIETERVHPHLVERCNRMDRICVPSSFTRDGRVFSREGVDHSFPA